MAPSNTTDGDLTPVATRQQPRLRRLASKPLKLGRSIKRGLSPAQGRGSRPLVGSDSLGIEGAISGIASHETLGTGGVVGGDVRALAARGRTKPLDGEQPVITLRVRVIRCEGLIAKDRNGTSDPFITLTLSPTPRQQTPVIRRSLAPDYTSSTTSAKSVFDFPLYKSLAQSGYYSGRGLELVVWDKDLMRKEYMGEVSIPISRWFENSTKEAVIWADSIPTLSFPLHSTRRRSTATGSVYLQIGLVADTKNDVASVWKELAQSSQHSIGSLMGVPAYEGIGTVKMKRLHLRRSPSQSSWKGAPSEASAGVSSAAATPAIFPSGSQPLPEMTTSLEDVDEGEEEEEELKDDGLSTSSEDEDEDADGGLHAMARVGIQESSLEDEHAQTTPISSSPLVLLEDADTGEKQSLINNKPPPGKTVRGESAASTSSSESKPGYFDLRPSARRKRQEAKSGVTTPLGTPGGFLTPSGAATPGAVTPGATTPGGRARRPIFRKSKSKMTDYNFNSEKDILGIVILEVQGAEDLPRLKNALKIGFDMDPFVVISFGKKVFRTRVIRHSLNPVWEEKLLFHVRKYEDTFSLQFSVLDWDKVTGNDFIGSSMLPLAGLIADAPKPHPETGLYDADQDGKHEMKDFKLSITTAKDMGWEAKHSPLLHVRAKYEPYDALRQRFWRQYCAQYDTDDTGTMSHMELTTMLDSLSSTLTQQTLGGYFTSFNKTLSDELTIEQVIICLEREIRKSADEKNCVELDGYSSEGQTPAEYSMAPKPTKDGLDVVWPAAPKPINPDELDAQIRASQPRSDNEDSSNSDTNVKPVQIGPNNALSASSTPSISRAESEEEESRTGSPADKMERVVNIKSCPLCHRPRLNAKSEADIVTHLAVCASADWSRVDRLVVGNYVTASQAQRKFLSKVLTKVAIGAYSLGANSANIIVQDRATGQLLEEKMAIYVRIGIRVLYKGAKRGMEGSRARKLLKSMSVKQGRKYDSPASAAEIPAFIAFHNLDVSEILEPLHSYKTFNQFFYRKLKADARPISSPDDPNIAVSCADCRMMAFETVGEATQIWIKGREFSVGRLLGDAYKGQLEAYEGGALGIFRLAPQDYHRFHSPVDGIIGHCSDIEGEYYTVNPQAIRTTLDVYGENVRKIVPIDSPSFGRVMTVWIGAMMVGSIGSTVKQGDEVKRGDELGWFAFGGSTLVLLFEKGALRWDEDLLQNSRASIETLVRMGMHVGTAVRRGTEGDRQIDSL